MRPDSVEFGVDRGLSGGVVVEVFVLGEPGGRLAMLSIRPVSLWRVGLVPVLAAVMVFTSYVLVRVLFRRPAWDGNFSGCSFRVLERPAPPRGRSGGAGRSAFAGLGAVMEVGFGVGDAGGCRLGALLPSWGGGWADAQKGDLRPLRGWGWLGCGPAMEIVSQGVLGAVRRPFGGGQRLLRC